MIEDMKLIGYVQLYFKVTGKNNIYYYLLDCDFRNPLSQERLDELRRITKKGYEQIEPIENVEFVTKEEYTENTKDYKTTTISWNEEEENNEY